jgi:predicted transcriptional regulator
VRKIISLVQQIETAASSLAMAHRSTEAARAMAENGESTREAVYAALVRAFRPCSCREISHLAGVSRQGAHEHLKMLLARGVVINVGKSHRAVYAVTNTRNARLIQAEPAWLEDLDDGSCEANHAA